MKYSLSDYIVTFEANDRDLRAIFDVISVGGQGSALGTITVEQATDQWTTNGFATGAWVHTKSFDRHGSVSIDISQLAPEIEKFKKLSNVHYTGDYDGLIVTVTNRTNQPVATCTDCYFTKIPNQVMSDTAQNQTWTLTCGVVEFN